MVIAHQFMSQVPDALQDAVIGTANTTIATHPPRPGGKRLEAVRNRTRARYARPRATVEEEITRFLDQAHAGREPRRAGLMAKGDRSGQPQIRVFGD